MKALPEQFMIWPAHSKWPHYLPDFMQCGGTHMEQIILPLHINQAQRIDLAHVYAAFFILNSGNG